MTKPTTGGTTPVVTAASRRAVRAVLPAVPSAVAYGRLVAKNVMRQWRLQHLSDVVELLASELVTNGIEATSTVGAGVEQSVELRLVSIADSFFVGVRDHNPSPPVLREQFDGAECGRGLFLVDALSSRWWHLNLRRGGKVVWAELDAAVPTTASGLPIRTPLSVPPAVLVQEPDLEVLRKVVERLKVLT
ncbi:ATP-binding protein [Frankia sp. Cr2]|uniref:ATP-binding protein n=1 Tax=Frankia sp. Cr2 TaxID=3073932 RepID=UPI002AD4D3AD|nr:ATP-binding protein [Frankia sp. Cr2]